MNNFIFMVLCGSLILNTNIIYIIYMKYLKKTKVVILCKNLKKKMLRHLHIYVIYIYI